MTISTVVVAYRNYDDLVECLVSLQTAQPRPSEIIVVDSDSDPGQLALVRQRFPGVTYLASEKNLGYARGNNLGMQAAHGDVFFLLNPDTVVHPDIFLRVEEAFQRSANVAAVQPLVTIYGTKLINCAGLEVQYLGFAWGRDYRRLVEVSMVGTSLAAFSGSAVFLRRSALDRVGRFDERYFMYHEDVDVSLRLRNAGYTISLMPSAVVEHKYVYKTSRRQFYLLERNRWLTVLKNFPIRALLFLGPAAVFLECGLIIQSVREGWWREKLRAMGDALRLLPSILQSRQQGDPATSSALFHGVRGPIAFGELQHPLLRFVANPFLRLYWSVVRPWL